MKFKNYIETESGIKDTSSEPGTVGQVLSSTGTGTSWIDQSSLVSAASKLVVISCKNTSGSTINKGTPVYQTGTVGATDVIEVAPADALISSGSQPAIGILQTTLVNNNDPETDPGNVVITGEFLNYSTSGIPTNNPGGVPITGDTVYLAAGGGLTCIKPTGPGNAIQNLGLIGKVSGGSAGSITVSSIMRANDVPNLPEGRIWIGDGNTIVSDTVYVDEPNGRVGIGTDNPATPLHVYGTIDGEPTTMLVENGDTTITLGQLVANLEFRANDASVNGVGAMGQLAMVAENNGSVYGMGLYTKDGTPGVNEVMRLSGYGNVGIGTTDPGAKLEVVGESGVIIDSGTSNQAKLTLIGDGGSYGGGGIIDVIGGSSDYITYDLNVKRSPNTMEASNRYWMGSAGWSWDGNIGATRGQPYTSYDFKSQGSSQMVIYNNNVGIGTTSPQSQIGSTKILDISSNGNGEVILDHTDAGTTSDIGLYSWNRNNDHLAHIKATCDGATDAAFISFHTQATGGSFLNPSSNEKMRIKSNGNVGIGAINPNSKLQVDGEIDANGGDGYRINGKPWAAESSNNLRLGDWDGEGFSTSIFDENTIEILKVKDRGVIINNDRTNVTTYGADASLVVGGDKFSPWGPGVVTLLNNDPSSQTNDSTGTIQFAIRDDQNTSAGYTSASIKGSVSFAAGSGSSGGGILDFLTSSGGLGSSPATHMRIDRLGNVGIGTTSPRSKLHVNGGVKLGNDTAAASAAKVGTFRYYTSGNNSYVDMCMQTGASTYAWVNIVTNSW